MKLDDVKKLHQKKYRSQFGYYIVEGEHLILELVKASKVLTEIQSSQLYVTEEYQDWANELNSGFKILTVSKKQMAQLSDTKTPQGILAAVPLPSKSVSSNSNSAAVVAKSAAAVPKKVQRCIYLHEVQDPGNLGTILRTLAWFGNFRLLLSPNSVDPFNSKVVRSSMGAIFHVPMELDVELADLSSRFEKFAYLDMGGAAINSSEFSDYPCYLFGNEARGVPREALVDFNATAFTIPGNGSIESLNLASAVNMSAYQLSV
jgi:TrmH family RNA methyltransferase